MANRPPSTSGPPQTARAPSKSCTWCSAMELAPPSKDPPEPVRQVGSDGAADRLNRSIDLHHSGGGVGHDRGPISERLDPTVPPPTSSALVPGLRSTTSSMARATATCRSW